MKLPVHLALFFKDFAVWVNQSCTGLHVAGYCTAQVLRKAGIDVHVFPVRNNIDVAQALENYNARHDNPITHVVISAPWLSVWDLSCLVEAYPETQFVVLSHSNVGFLQADPDGVHLLRKYMDLPYENLKVGGNSQKFVEWLDCAYAYDAEYLPNLYPMEDCREPKRWENPFVLKIGAFGAVRPYKNFMTAAAAALALSEDLFYRVEFHMSSGGEGDGWGIIPAIEQMLDGTGVRLVKHDWKLWRDFIEVVGQMDLLLQPSYTESFNMITADGIWAGVPSVVSPAIGWAPDSWWADPDDANDIARVAKEILNNKTAVLDGRKAIQAHNEDAFFWWKLFLFGEVEYEEPRSWFSRLWSRILGGRR